MESVAERQEDDGFSSRITEHMSNGGGVISRDETATAAVDDDTAAAPRVCGYGI